MKIRTLVPSALVLAGFLAGGTGFASSTDPVKQLTSPDRDGAPARSVVVSGVDTATTTDPVLLLTQPKAVASTAGKAPAERLNPLVRSVDGYALTMHVMEYTSGKTHGQEHSTHNLMAKLEQAGNAVYPREVSAELVHPGGEKEIVTFKRMGEWYMAGVDLRHVEGHALELGFTMPDGGAHGARLFLN